jgi:hypothetical protein
VIPERDIRDEGRLNFYADIVPFTRFAEITHPEHYRTLPTDWMIGLTDVVHSTQAIARGRYKAVNAVGAAVLAAVSNALPRTAFPFAFGGDGASLAVPGSDAQSVRETLARTAAWSEDELELSLRVGLVPVAAIRAAGFDVRVARFAASRAVSYAMFAGGGLAWAEARLKEGQFAVPRAAPGERPELGGLYCGFAPIKARRGVILSLIAIPAIDEAAFVTLVDDVLALLDETEDFGHPLRKKGPLPAWAGGGIEGAIASTAGRLGPLARPHVVIRAVTSRLLFAAGIPLRGFHPAHYRRQLVDNTDFRKFDDALRMTVDCTPESADAIEALLEAARRAGTCRFGTHRQDSANLTCFVPSLRRDDHVHFVDGAAGGYAAAAAKLKTELGTERLPLRFGRRAQKPSQSGRSRAVP